MKIIPFSGNGITTSFIARSKTYIIACKARELAAKLDWLEALEGDKLITDLIGKS